MARKPDNERKHRASDLSPEDAALFDSTMRDVRKFIRRAPAPAPGPPVGEKAPRVRPPPRPRAAVDKATRPALPPLAPGESADVDARTLDRLRRGRLQPEARLDLHGMTQADAHRALIGFLSRAQAGGTRCVVVITGKGRVSEGGGVLRNQVPQWLNSPAIRPRILAFAPAQPRDGGTGALYVLLRRVRSVSVRG